ncbi:MAG: dihydrodipicolinate synthase family protein [Candidatus Sumerlaeia bacterium]|nr:dihydrodipicolinate synthase family protein [Candidatus Sumerlaeia bacterium]
MIHLQAPAIAILTPFDKSGHVDFGAFGDYLQYLHDAGVRTLIVNGTTAEFPSLTQEERQEILEFVRRRFEGALLANISSCSTRECQTHLDHCQKFADALLLLPPYYYASPRPEGVREFLATTVRRCEKPVYLYNFPRHTQVSLTPELVGSLAAEFPVIRGVKDSSGSVENALAYQNAAPNLKIFFGGDSRALEILQEGLHGSSSGAGSALPEYLVGIHRAFHEGRIDKASDMQERFNKWHHFRKHSGLDEIAITKAAVATRLPGFPTASRPPMTSVDDTMRVRISEIIRDFPPA